MQREIRQSKATKQRAINTPARYQRNEPHLQWFLQISPRLTTPAGFEIGSGIRVNSSLPEEDAAMLRCAG